MLRFISHNSAVDLIDGVKVIVTYKRMKNIILRPDLKNHIIRVSAPLGCPESSIVDFIHQHIDRLKTDLSKRYFYDITQIELLEGSIVPYLGKTYSLSFINVDDGCERSITPDIESKKIYIRSYPGDSKDVHFELLMNWYFKQFVQLSNVLIKDVVQELGYHAKTYKQKVVNSYWGVCRKNRSEITLNPKLIALPPELIKMVIIHEHVHLKIANHGPQFKHEMRRLVEDYDAKEKLLRKLSKLTI